MYSLNSLGGRITLRHQPNPHDVWTVSLRNEYQRSTITPEALEDFTIRDELIALGLDPRDGQAAGTLSAVAFEVNRNTADNLLDARTGYVLNGRVEQAGRWLPGAYDYWSLAAGGRHYLSVARRLVVASRVQAGSIDALGPLEQNVPFHRRYFLGGRPASVGGAGSRSVRSADSACRSAGIRCSKDHPSFGSRCGASSAPWPLSITAMSGRSPGTST